MKSWKNDMSSGSVDSQRLLLQSCTFRHSKPESTFLRLTYQVCSINLARRPDLVRCWIHAILRDGVYLYCGPSASTWAGVREGERERERERESERGEIRGESVRSVAWQRSIWPDGDGRSGERKGGPREGGREGGISSQMPSSAASAISSRTLSPSLPAFLPSFPPLNCDRDRHPAASDANALTGGGGRTDADGRGRRNPFHSPISRPRPVVAAAAAT